MKIQIIGKITGDPDYKAKFDLVRRALELKGYEVWNPADLPAGRTYEQYMKCCLAQMEHMDAICCIDDWEKSPGAKREYMRAQALGLPVVPAKILTTVKKEIILGPPQRTPPNSRAQSLIDAAEQRIREASELLAKAKHMQDAINRDGERHEEETKKAQAVGSGTAVHERYA